MKYARHACADCGDIYFIYLFFFLVNKGARSIQFDPNRFENAVYMAGQRVFEVGRSLNRPPNV